MTHTLTRRGLRTVTAAVAVSAVAMTLAACGSSGGSGDITYEDSPLSKMFTSVLGESMYEPQDNEQANAELQARNRKQQELIAQCMATEGFDYVPDTENHGYSWSSEEYDGLDPMEYARQFGYGVTTWEDTPSGKAMAEMDLNNGSDWTDPNAETVEAMSDAEREAWYEALWGTQTYEEPEDPDAEITYEWNWEEQGCYGWSENELSKEDGQDALSNVYEDPQFTDFLERMNESYTRAESDPRSQELRSSWSQCMADAGYPGFVEVWDAQNSIYDAQSAMYDDISAQYEALSDAERENFTYTEPDMTALREQEIATATADVACQQELDLRATQLAIQFEYEQQFIDSNRAELDAFLDALAQAQAAKDAK